MKQVVLTYGHNKVDDVFEFGVESNDTWLWFYLGRLIGRNKKNYWPFPYESGKTKLVINYKDAENAAKKIYKIVEGECKLKQ